MDHETRIKRLRFRAWHRGTKEADLMIGGFFDAHHETLSLEELDWFEALLEEQDVDIGLGHRHAALSATVGRPGDAADACAEFRTDRPVT